MAAGVLGDGDEEAAGMRVLIAGTGSIGQRHLRNLVALDPTASVVVLREDGREDALSKELEATVVTGFEQALDQPIDALLIATPSALHTDLLINGIRCGLPIFVEKPVVTTAADLAAVTDCLRASAYQAPSQVGFNLRWLASLQLLRALLGVGVIGAVARASLEAGQWLPDWRPAHNHRMSYSADPDRGGGVLFDLVHELDVFRWCLGDPSELQVMTAQLPALEIRSEAVAAIQLRSGSGAVVQIGLDYVARKPLRRYQWVGERGTLCWDLQSKQLILHTSDQTRCIADRPKDFELGKTYQLMMMNFLAALRGEGATAMPLEEGLASTALAVELAEQVRRQA